MSLRDARDVAHRRQANIGTANDIQTAAAIVRE
jgi:hypothetical protein